VARIYEVELDKKMKLENETRKRVAPVAMFIAPQPWSDNLFGMGQP